MSEAALREVCDQLATLGNYICAANRGDEIAALAMPRIIEGLEFEVMRAAWLLGEKEEAARIHGLIGEHGERCCPVCVGEAAYAPAAVPGGADK